MQRLLDGPVIKTLPSSAGGPGSVPGQRVKVPHASGAKKWKLLSCVQLFATPWIVACQAPLSVEFFRPEYWSG